MKCTHDYRMKDSVLICTECLSEKDKRYELRSRMKGMQEASNNIIHYMATIAKLHIPDWHFMNWTMFPLWDCDESPIGVCVFSIKTHHCRYCNEPDERK